MVGHISVLIPSVKGVPMLPMKYKKAIKKSEKKILNPGMGIIVVHHKKNKRKQ